MYSVNWNIINFNVLIYFIIEVNQVFFRKNTCSVSTIFCDFYFDIIIIRKCGFIPAAVAP